MLKNRSQANILYIDLSKKDYYIKNRPELLDKYIGGTGIAAQLLLEECPEGCDPLSPESPIILAVGPLTPFFPLASKTVALFKSPLTGNLGESHCGGRSAISIASAQLTAIVIKGKSKKPVFLTIDNQRVYFKDATTLWGMDSNFTTGRILRQHEKGSGIRTIMRIGKGGENKVLYSGVNVETFRHFGRLGLGAVFGSKHLKALVITGQSTLEVTDNKEYKKVYKEIYETATESKLMNKYHDLGTAGNVKGLSDLGGLPTRNLQSGSFEKAEDISGESFAKEHLGRRLACSHCPVGCIHVATLREPDPNDPFFFKTSMIGYDYEPIFAAGSMLGIHEKKGFLRLVHKVDSYGLDVMSAGVAMGWATEALEKGVITEKETQLKLKFGDWKTYIECVKKIVDRENDFYEHLAQGVEIASDKYGGKEFAMAFGKNEMAGYHTGPAAHIGLIIGSRHSHLDNGGYSMDQSELMKKLLPPEEVVDKLYEEEAWRQILSSLVVCFFARGIYSKELVTKTLALVGLDFAENDLMDVGNKILALKHKFKLREGFKFSDVRLPERIFETPTPVKNWDRKYIEDALAHADKFMQKNA